MKALGLQRAGLGFLSGRTMKRSPGILSQLMGRRAKEAGLGSEGLRSFCSPGANRDRLCLIVKGPEL